MGKKKDKKKKKEEEEVADQINVEDDKNLFQDIFGVTIEDIEKEEEEADDKYEDILEELDGVREEIAKEEAEIKEIAIVEEEPMITPSDDLTKQDLEEEKASFLEEVNEIVKDIPGEPKPIAPKIVKLKFKEELKPIAPIIVKPEVKEILKPKQIKETPKQPSPPTPIMKKPIMPPPPSFKKFQVKPILASLVKEKPKAEETPIKTTSTTIKSKGKEIKVISQAPGVIKTISFDDTAKRSAPAKKIKVIEPKPGFKAVKIFAEEEEKIHEKPVGKNVELSDIRCGDCGTRITKEAEASLKTGWIINCESCGHQIISN